MNTTATPADRVLAGANFLDLHGPENWREKIDLERLDLADATQCILGQLYGTYHHGCVQLDIVDFELRQAYGFTGTYSDSHELTEAWRQYLTPRPLDSTPEPSTDVEEFIEQWGDKLEKMYTNRTAGDHSFTGFVVALMLDMRRKGVQPL